MPVIAQAAQLAQEGDLCSTDSIDLPNGPDCPRGSATCDGDDGRSQFNRHCGPGLICKGRPGATKDPTTKIWNPPGGDCRTFQKKNLTCECVTEQQGTIGANGYRCKDENGVTINVLPDRAANPNDLSIAYCRADEQCFNRPGATHGPTFGGTLPHPYGTPEEFELKGVSCTREVQANCRCENPGAAGGGNGQNRILCVNPGGPDISGRTGPQQADEVAVTYCDPDHLACTTSAGVADPNTVKDDPFAGNDQFAGARLAGVTCGLVRAQCECTGTPNKQGSGVNSIRCTLPSGKVAEGYCPNEKACIPSGQINESQVDKMDDNKRNNGRETDETPFNNADLMNVSCETVEATPTLPPPPSPPCSEGRWVNGQCTSLITGLGELSTEPGEFISSIFAVLLSVSGGIALLLILKAGYQIMTSQGKPEQLQGGRDQLTAAIVGLIFLVFSFIVLQVIGFDILRIPGFAGPGGGGAGQFCDLNGNNQCPNGLQCTPTGNGRNGTCQ